MKVLIKLRENITIQGEDAKDNFGACIPTFFNKKATAKPWLNNVAAKERCGMAR